MALIIPFINKINAFDATKGSKNSIFVNVLGGEKISKISYYVYKNNDDSLVFSYTINVNDRDTSDIRSFLLPSISSSNGILNNYDYYINAKTINSKNEESHLSSNTYFECYKEPKFIVKYKNNNIEKDMKTLSDNTILKSENCYLFIDFDKNDIHSKASLNSLNLEIYGISKGLNNSNKEYKIYESNNIYVKTTGEDYYEISINNLNKTSGSEKLYDNYKFIINGITTDFMEFKNIINNIKVEYENLDNLSYFELFNNEKKGYIEIEVNLEELFNNIEVETIARIDLKKRKVNINKNGDWITLQSIYSYNNNNNNKFVIYDTYCSNNQLYDYKISIYDESGNESNPKIKQILSKFYGNYICDYNEIYDITLNFNVDSSKLIQKSAIYEPYGAIYPFVAYNANTKYNSAQITTILLAKNDSYIDKLGQIELKEKFNNFLSNKKAKILKDFNGNIMIISIVGDIEFGNYNELGNSICSTTFNYVEIGNFEEGIMNKLGLLGFFEMHFIE